MSIPSQPAPRRSDAPAPQALSGDQWHDKLRDGTTVLIRPIRAADLDLERRFIADLSAQSRRFRFLGQVCADDAALLTQLTHPDPTRDVALVALVAEGAHKREIGVARFSADRSGVACECAVTVADEWHGRGLGTLLMQHLIDIARHRGYKRIYSIDAMENSAMRELAAHLGFVRKVDEDDPHQVVHVLELTA